MFSKLILCDDYTSDSETKSFNIRDKIIDKCNDTTYLVKLHFRDLVKYTSPWKYNRTISEEKSNELLESLKDPYNIPWVLHAICEIKKKDDDEYQNIFILDGQHRYCSIREYIINFDNDMTCDRHVWVWIYEFSDIDTKNLAKVITLFKKINNNNPINENEVPDIYIIDLINHISKNPLLKNGIGTKKINNTCQVPCIHQKELNAVFNDNKTILCTMTYDMILENLLRINNILSLKKYEDLFGKDKTQKKKYEKATELKFYLNLGKKSKYPIEMLLKYINRIDEL
jgi:hypothetical protein